MSSNIHAIQNALNRTEPAQEIAIRTPHTDTVAIGRLHNRYLRFVILAETVVILALCGIGVKLAFAIRDIKPIVVRIDEHGAATTAPYVSLQYKPREPEAKFFLSLFTKDHYGRNRFTAHEAFSRKLYFLPRSISAAMTAEENEKRTLTAFLTGTDPDVEIAIKNVYIEELVTPPFRASVDFEKVFRSPQDGRELKRERYRAQYWFTFQASVPNRLIQHNPLGMVISRFREDQEF